MAQSDADEVASRLGGAGVAVYVKATLGFALLYSACVSFYYRSWLFGYSSVSDQVGGAALNIAIVSASLALAACASMRRSFKGMRCVQLGVALLLAGSVLAYGSLPGGWGNLAYVASVACAGTGMGLALPCCYEMFSRLPPRWIAVAYGLVAAGGMLCALVAEQFGPMVLLVSNVAFLLACAVLLAMAQREASLLYERSTPARAGSRGLEKRFRSIPWRRLCDSFLVAGVCVFAISVVYGVLSATAAGTETPRDVSAPMAQIGGLIVGILFLLYFGLKKRKPTVLLFNVVFGIVGAAILLLPFLQSSHVSLLYAFASAAWKLMLLILLYLVAITFASNRRELIACLALACALPRLGLLVGSLMASALNVGIESDFTRLTAIAVFFLYLLSMVMWFINSFERKRAEERADTMGEMLKRYSEAQDDVRTLRIDAIAEKAALTKREREVLGMMARGRDLAYICDELYLSRNTVKGYQKSIYAKLGVHSKQEIINLVDGA